MSIRFLLYGLAGWCLEIFWTGLGSLLRGDVKLQGRTYLWMFPIYGLAILLEPLHNAIRHWPVLTRGSIYAICILFAEYTSGWLLRSTVGVCPWDYSGTPLSVNGLIRLDYTPAWFVAGLLFEKFHDYLIRVTT